MQLIGSTWAPHAYVVTFKLETDEALLRPKSRAALAHYHHQLGMFAPPT